MRLSSFVQTAVLAAVLPLPLFWSCTSNSHPNPSPSAHKTASAYDTTAVHLALMPTSDCFPFYYAERTGIYQKLGLQVAIHTYTSQLDCDTAMLGQYMDAGYADAIRIRETKLSHSDLRTLSKGTDCWQLVVSGPLRVHDASKLKDRLVALARQSEEDAYLTACLRKANVKADDVYRPLINDVKLRAEMVNRRQVDATMLRWPFTSLAQAFGDRVISAQKTSESGALLVAHTKSLKQRLTSKNLELLKRGYKMAQDSILANKRTQISFILQRDYLLPQEVADTIQCLRTGFFQ